MKTRRYLGTSHLFKVGTNHEFRNGLDIRLDDDGAAIEISSAIEPGRRVPLAGTPAEARLFRKMILAMEREDLRARRQAGEFAFFKERPRRRKPATPPVCDQCGGYGGNEKEDGSWMECPACSDQS